MMRVGLLLLAVLVTAGCAANPWNSPEGMVAFQKKHYGYMGELYPAGMGRQQVRGITSGKFVATIGLPLSDEDRAAYAGSQVGLDLPVFVEAAELATGQRARSVDVYEFFGGHSGWGVEARYIFYDADGRVLIAFGSPWEE